MLRAAVTRFVGVNRLASACNRVAISTIIVAIIAINRRNAAELHPKNFRIPARMRRFSAMASQLPLIARIELAENQAVHCAASGPINASEDVPI